MIIRKQTLEKFIYCSTNARRTTLGEPHISISELKEKIEKGDESICKKILNFSDTLSGSSQYWSRRYKEVRSLEEYLINEGKCLSSIFCTGSCVEFHFKPLRRLLELYVKLTGDKHIDLDNHNNLYACLQENSHIVASFFDKRTTSYFENGMGPVFGVSAYWYRQAFAKSRGMIHWHGRSWREDKEPHKLLHDCVVQGLSETECAQVPSYLG